MSKYEVRSKRKISSKYNKLKTLWLLLRAKQFIVMTNRSLSINCDSGMRDAAVKMIKDESIQTKDRQS